MKATDGLSVQLRSARFRTFSALKGHKVLPLILTLLWLLCRPRAMDQAPRSSGKQCWLLAIIEVALQGSFPGLGDPVPVSCFPEVMLFSESAGSVSQIPSFSPSFSFLLLF